MAPEPGLEGGIESGESGAPDGDGLGGGEAGLVDPGAVFAGELYRADFLEVVQPDRFSGLGKPAARIFSSSRW